MKTIRKVLCAIYLLMLCSQTTNAQEFNIHLSGPQESGIQKSIELSNGDFLLLIQETGYPKIVLIRFDASGTIIWQTSFGENQHSANCALELSDGTILVGGHLLDNGQIPSVFFHCFSSSGNLLWGKEYSISGNPGLAGIYEIPGNGIFFTGNYNTTGTGNEFFVGKMDMTGNINWLKGFVSSINFLHINNIHGSTDGLSLFISGVEFSTQHSLLFRINTNGVPIYSKEIYSPVFATSVMIS